MSNAARRVALIAAIAVAVLAAGDAAPAHGASFTVNATHDSVDAAPGDGVCADTGGACTLRAAVEETNALAGADAVVVPAGTYVLTVTEQVQGGADIAGLRVRGDVTLTGAGAAITIIDGGGQAVVVSAGKDSPNPVSLEISDLSIRNGNGPTTAGGIDTTASSTLTLRRVALTGNSGSTGGLRVRGTANVVDSLIAGNAAAASGGGILVQGTLTVTNSTISGNSAQSSGGGIRADGTTSITNVTIALNTSGGASGGVQARNSIFASNGSPDCIISQGHNLVADPCAPLTGPGDLGGVDPQMTGLQDNGGPTLTHGLYPGSPAIDAGDSAVCPGTDQRGVPRSQGAACDIGAYEYVPPAQQPPAAPPDTAPPAAPATAAPTAAVTPRATASPSPSPSASATAATRAARRARPATPFPNAPDADFVVEEESGGGSPWLTLGLGTMGVLGVAGGVAGGGYWYRRRRRGRLR
ncbi:MAG TPA: choice-of-anchor Q domain-containing protein [Dehalococcoidia bacterium]|nr:choice-of-anchor Q domain-containing protein [Dehalococcoidia bacterium]